VTGITNVIGIAANQDSDYFLFFS